MKSKFRPPLFLSASHFALAQTDARKPSSRYGNALTASAYDGTLQILENLIDHGADVNSPDGWALQTAAEHGNVEIVQLLLRRGADVNALTTHPNMSYGTALQAAVEAGNEEIVILLLEYRADPDKGPPPDPETGYQTCPLIAAIEGDWRDILERLIHARANLQVVGGRYSAGPIGCAANVLPLPSIKLLLDSGADINIADEDGDTALMLEAWEGDAEVVQFLLDRGADVLHRNKQGQNALQLAIQSQNIDIVNAVVSHVSLIMEDMRVAVEAGDRSVTAIVRSVQTRNQALDYGDPSPEKSEEKVDIVQAVPETGSVVAGDVVVVDRDQLPSASQHKPEIALHSRKPVPSASARLASQDGTNAPILWQPDEAPMAARAQTFPMLASEDDSKLQYPPPLPQRQQQPQQQEFTAWQPGNAGHAPLGRQSQESQLNSALTGDTLVSSTAPDGYYGSFQPAGAGGRPSFDHRASSIHTMPASQPVASPPMGSTPASSPPIASPQFQHRPASNPGQPGQPGQPVITPYNYVSPYKQQHQQQQRQPLQPRYLSYQLQHPQRVDAENYQQQSPQQSPPPSVTPYNHRVSISSMQDPSAQSPPMQGGRRPAEPSARSSYLPWSGQ